MKHHFFVGFAAFASLLVSSFAQLSITEFLAVNLDGPEDKDGDFSPWIEVYNASDDPIDLKDWYLTNDAGDPTKWKVPRKQVPSKGHALLFASGKDFGSLFNAEVHANFKLPVGIEYLALVHNDGYTVADAYEDLPRQRAGFSYGRHESGQLTYFRTPTPLQPNQNPIEGFVSDTKFSVDRGFFDQAFQVEITTETPDATIIYTTSGREPSQGSIFTGPIEHVYDGPITIDKTTVLRAAAFKKELGPSNIDSQTYIFTDDVIAQPTMRTAITQSNEYGPKMTDALLAVPSISIGVEDFDFVAHGSSSTNDEERPVTVEWLNPDGSKGFKINAGISRFGGYYTNFPKKSFRLYFRKSYDDATLQYPIFRNFENGRAPAEEFDSINLRSGSHDMQARGAYMSNRFVDDTMLEMEGMAPHGRFVHLYLNGTYWGQYHLRERWNGAMHASYFGGIEEDYDAINGNDNFTNDFKAYDGDLTYWREVEALARGDSPWEALQGHVDLGDYLDFMMVWGAGNSESEFQAVGSKKLGVPFTFYLKDADGWLINGSISASSARARFGDPGPGRFNQELRSENHPDFQIFLADRIHKHFFNGGALTAERNIARLQKRVDEIETSFIAESARWNFQSPSGWRNFQERSMETHLATLTDVMIEMFENMGAYPDDIQAPIFNRHGGEIERSFILEMHAGTLFNPELGDFFYTLDGSDPRLPGGAKSPHAIQYERMGPGVILEDTVIVKARTFRPSLFSEGTWSPLTEATFHIGKRPEPGDLIISEIHYRPAPPSDAEIAAGFDTRGLFEFIELYNRSDFVISLIEVAFNSGFRFEFAGSDVTELAPGKMAVAVRDRAAFEARYGTGLPVAGAVDGFKLSDSGETIRLSLLDGVLLQELRYNDKDPWPEGPDGNGPSLTLDDPGTMDGANPRQWRASVKIGGSPGKLEGDEPADDVDFDGDGLTAFLEKALGSSDTDPTSGPAAIALRLEPVEVDGESVDHWTFETTRNPVTAGLVFQLERSPDLRSWTPADEIFAIVEGRDADSERLKWRSLVPAEEMDEGTAFVRLRVSRE